MRRSYVQGIALCLSILLCITNNSMDIYALELASSDNISSENEQNENGDIQEDTYQVVPDVYEEHVLTEPAANSVSSGTCGDNLTWTLSEDGILVISGTGAMYGYGTLEGPPWGRTKVKKAIIEEGVTTIGAVTMAQTNMIEVELPSTLESIGNYAFYNAKSLEKVEIPDGVTYIHNAAFRGCSSLNKVIIPASVKFNPNASNSIAAAFFDGCSNLKTAGPSGGDYNIEYAWKNEIPSFAFTHMNSLEKVVLPDSISYIGSYVFYNCSNIQEINIPDNVTAVGMGCFASCTMLENVEFPPDFIEVATSMFEGCSSLKSIVWSENLAIIGSDAFSGCSSLEIVEIPESVVKIKTAAFVDCTSLQKLIIPSSVQEIGYSEYSSSFLKGCTLLKNAGPIGSGCSIEYGWEDEIPANAFRNSSIENIEFASTISSIGDNAFSSCNSLKSLMVPDSILKIGNYVFSNCRYLSDVEIFNDTIGIGMFYRCLKLENLVLPDRLKRIEEYGLAECETLQQIIIPKNVNYIGKYAFRDCSNLSIMAFVGNRPTLYKNIFYNDCLTVYYPGSNNTWPADMDQFGFSGEVIWVPYNPLNVADKPTEAFVTINGKGTASAYYYLADEDAMSLPYKKFVYTYSYDGKTYTMFESEFITDYEGGYTFKTPVIEYKGGTPENNSYDIEYSVSLLDGDNIVLYNTKFTTHVTITALTYVEEWSIKLDQSLDLAHSSFENGSTATIELQHNEDASLDLKLSLRLSKSLVAKLSGKVSDVLGNTKDSILDVALSASGKASSYDTYSTTIEDFSFNDKDDKEQLAAYLALMLSISYMAHSTTTAGNVMILQLLESCGYIDIASSLFEVQETGISVKLSANSNTLNLPLEIKSDSSALDVSLIEPVKLNSVDSNSVYSYSAALENGEYTYKSGFKAESGYSLLSGNLFPLMGIAGMQGYLKVNDTSISATEDMYVLKVGDYDSGWQDYVDNWNQESTYRTYMATDKAYDTLNEKSYALARLATGISGPISSQTMNDISTEFEECTDVIIYSDTIKQESSIAWSPSVGITFDNFGDVSSDTSDQIGIEDNSFDISFGGTVTLLKSVETEAANGVYEEKELFEKSNSEYAVTKVQESSTDLSTIFQAALGGLGESFSSLISVASGSITEGVKHIGAEIKSVLSTSSDWKVSILSNTINSQESNYARSYAIATFASEVTDVESVVSTTVGKPYIVMVKDSENNIVNNLSEQPLTLVLNYTEEELLAANISNSDVENLAIYRFDDVLNGYVYIGGVVDSTSQTVTVNIMETGEYILIADSATPVVNNIDISDNSNIPTIMANIADASGITNIQLYIDGTLVVDENNYTSYYDRKAGLFSYQVNAPLSIGEHEIEFNVTDGKGNSTEKLFQFSVVEAPQIEELSLYAYSLVGDTLTISARVSSINQEVNISNVIASITTYDEKENTVNMNYDMHLVDGVWSIDFQVTENVSKYEVFVSAYDENENYTRSDMKSCLISKDGTAEYDIDDGILSVNLLTGKVSYYEGDATKLIIPSHIYGHIITNIGSNAFRYADSLTTVILPDTINSIQDYAFSYHNGLISVEIPETVQYIGKCAFLECVNLQSITIPNKIETVESRAFEGCSSLVMVNASEAWLKNVNINELFAGTPWLEMNKVVLTDFSLNLDVLNLVLGESENVLLKINNLIPDNTTDVIENIVWVSSDTSVATVQDGLVQAISVGDSVITAIITNSDGEAISKNCYVSVVNQGDIFEQTNPFSDIKKDAWYYSAVKYAYANGLLTGTSDTTFSPNGPMTRGMLVTVLYRMEGRPAVSANTKFPDVASNKYYAKAISWASEENIVSGYSNGNFGPNDSITREQIAKVLYRYAEYKGYDVTASQSLDGFSDASRVSSYAKKYMQWATAEGLIKGSNGVLNPKGDATRAEISAILKRFIEKYE